jgi:hypothetical protein
MMAMNLGDELQQQVARLDTMVPREGAFFEMRYDGEGGACYANQAGYLRIGLEILKAALNTPLLGGTYPRIEVNVEDMMGENSDPVDFTLYLVDRSPSRASEALPGNNWLGLAIYTVIAILTALAAIGGVTVWKWFF